MKKRLSIISLWTATLMVLLSTVVMHHHHYERVCVALELCSHATGDTEAEQEESHSHQETDRGSCRVHQLHKFIINSGMTKNIRRHIIEGNHFVVLQLPDAQLLPVSSSRIVAEWQHTATPLSLRVLQSLRRRGPPVF